MPPSVSIIIPVYNDPVGLKETLDSLVVQIFPKDQYEVIMVDNGSTDNTSEIGRKVLGIFTLIPSLFPHRVLGKLIYYTAERKARALNPKDGLKFLFELDRNLYPLQGALAVLLDNGLHTKHRHTKYHEFFVEHIN